MAMKEYEMTGTGADFIEEATPGTTPRGNLMPAGGRSDDDASAPAGMWCGCLSVRFYKQFFNVDTKDVKDRWLLSLLCCRRSDQFLTIVGDNADAYGPFWNATTLVFLIALTTNVNSWVAFASGDDDDSVWEYDFTKLVTCTSIVYGFVAGVPLVGWLVFGQLEITLPLVHHLCVYGYALGPFLIAVLFCMVPNDVVVWGSLVAATAFSIVFLMRTLAPVVLEQNQSWAVATMAAYGVTQIALMLLLKFFFYN